MSFLAYIREITFNGTPSFDFSGITLGGDLALNTQLFASNGIVVVPEPSRVLFLMLGLLGLMLRRRRRSGI